VSLDQLVPVSVHAAAMPPSKLGLLPGSTLTVEQALLGLITKSANDAASALGELLGGDEPQFAQMMTLRARALGMSHTTFRNASGWPDPDQITTARDLATLARHLIQDYPVEYRYFSVPSFLFHGRMIPNHDHMLQTYPGADGLKTGYIEASGCNLVTSAVRGDVRLVGVVMGALNGVERDTHMASLLDAGFERMGVPISRGGPRSRMPALVASASAATLPAATLAPPASWRIPVRPPIHTVALAHAPVGRPVWHREWDVPPPPRAPPPRFTPAAVHPPVHHPAPGHAAATPPPVWRSHG
jgi:D-alanyl-D-alanine carboxypeptidase